VIVRVLGEGQWRIPAEHERELERLDTKLLEALERHDETAFRQALDQLLAEVHRVGSIVPPDELVRSDVAIPGPDASLEEVAALLDGEVR
jgi:hypothetical protein